MKTLKAGAFNMNENYKEVTGKFSEVYKAADKLFLDNHDLSRGRKYDHEKSIMTVISCIESDLGRELTDDEVDFLVSNF